MASNYTKIMYKDYEKIIEENEALKKELKETKEKLKQTQTNRIDTATVNKGD